MKKPLCVNNRRRPLPPSLELLTAAQQAAVESWFLAECLCYNDIRFRLWDRFNFVTSYSQVFRWFHTHIEPKLARRREIFAVPGAMLELRFAGSAAGGDTAALVPLTIGAAPAASLGWKLNDSFASGNGRTQ